MSDLRDKDVWSLEKRSFKSPLAENPADLGSYEEHANVGEKVM